MWFVALGCLLGLAKLAEFGPVAAWSWWVVLSPFAVAAAWWTIADSTGLTQRRAMDRAAEKTAERRERHLKDMGLDTFERPKDGRPRK
jgi:small Trp-rich protein